MTSTPLNLAIVGGGITGLTLALALLDHKIPITVYEAAPQFSEIGAGIGLGPNAVRAMSLISPLMLEAYYRCRTTQSTPDVWMGVSVGDERISGPDGTFAFNGRPGYKVGERLFSVPFSGLEGLDSVGPVHRAHFLDELVKLLPCSIARFGKRLINISSALDSEEAVLHFADGTTARHTAVLGCDGIKSCTRRVLLGSDKYDAVFSGKCAYRGLIPLRNAIDILGEERAMGSQFSFGYRGHVLTFPIEGRTTNVVAFTSRDEWTAPEWVTPVSREDMEADFKTWGPMAKELVKSIEQTDLWALFEHPPAPTYYGTKPRICLVGDAAHASTPHQGTGAGVGIEDCYILASLIGEAKTGEDLDRVFRAYDEVRRPRTQEVVRTSREAGELYQFELEGDDLDAVEGNMKARMRWIWEVDLRGELERARGIVGDMRRGHRVNGRL